MSPNTTSAPAAATVSKPSAQTGANANYAALMKQVKEAGLLGRTRGFYVGVASILVLALGGTVTGSILLGNSWFQLLMAAALGVILTQFAFLAHEASHRTILQSGHANDWLGRVLSTLVLGVSYRWWMNKHETHHGSPNVIGKDPDLDTDTIVFLEEEAVKQRGVGRWITQRQGYLFFPLLLLEGINLHILSIRDLFTAARVEHRYLELGFIAFRLASYFAIVFWALPLGMGFAFIGVQLAVFGFYMGASFAPNHKGMPVLPRDTRIDFMSKQVLTSRNITGGWAITSLMGGLNYQIEHHLFPNMPRPHLARARRIALQHCKDAGIPYTETTLMESYGIVVQYLNRVGLAARDPFQCPERTMMGRP